MKKLTLLFISLILYISSGAQISGNVNYQSQVRYSDNNINIGFNANNELVVSVKALANLKADSYVAIFNVTQSGKTTEEVNTLINSRIDRIRNSVASDPDVEFFVDMISFVPVYEYEVEKKLFSKKTYNEIPAGFEMKKNLHIRYTDPEYLTRLISLCSEAEIYDLVKVDHFSNDIDSVKRVLANSSRAILDEKLRNYHRMIALDTADLQKQLADGYKIVYPVEMYRSYQAYSSSSLNYSKARNANSADKSTTLYYQPVVNKEFDLVMNPEIVEPVIQVMYEVKYRLYRDRSMDKQYMIITPAGDIKTLDLGK